MISRGRVLELLNYDPKRGSFTWRNPPRTRPDLLGRPAGGRHVDGYLHVQLDGQKYLGHRLAWLIVHGVWPTNEIDHRNRQRQANQIKNLRDVTKSVNQQNRNGVKGADFHRGRGRWRARITVDKRCLSLGYFLTEDEAVAAYRAAKAIHHA